MNNIEIPLKLAKQLLTELPQAQEGTNEAINTLQEIFRTHEQNITKEATATSWINEIATIPSEEKRRNAIKEYLTAIYKKGHPKFFDFITTLGQINFPAREEDMLLPLHLEYEIITEAIQGVAQKQPDFENWIAYVKSHTNENENTQEEIYMKPGTPIISPKLEKFHAQIKTFLDNPSQRDRKYEILLNTFKKLIKEKFGKNYDGYYTTGTTNAFTALQDKFWKVHPNAHLYHTPNEYLVMPYKVMPQKRQSIDMDPYDPEEVFLQRIFDDVKKRELNGEEVCESVVILISSELRGGIRIFDVHRIAEIVEEKNKSLGYKKYHLWIDAAQDNRLFVHPKSENNPVYHPENPDLFIGDIVFSSKRIGQGTGRGLVLVNNNTYPPEEDIAYSLSESSGGGTNEDFLIDIIGGLYIETTQMPHQLADLTKTPSLWRLKGRGKFLDWEIVRAFELIKRLPFLKKHFRLEAQNRPLDSLEIGRKNHGKFKKNNERQGHRILRLAKNEKSPVNLSQLVNRLAKRGIKVDAEPAEGLPKVQEIDFNLPVSDFIHQVCAAQTHHANRLFHELLPITEAPPPLPKIIQILVNRSVTETLQEIAIKNQVTEKIQEQEIIRILLDVLHPENTLMNVLCAIDDELSSEILSSISSSCYTSSPSQTPYQI